MADMVKTFSKVTEYWLSDPSRALEAQTRLFAGYLTVWGNAISRARTGAEPPEAIMPDRGDKRFQDPEWGRNAFFDFLKQVYLVTSRWATDLVERADGLDEHTRHKASFYVKQVSNAISPSNFILTNPELFRETVASNGENLVRGMKMLAEDIAAGKGDLRLQAGRPVELRGGQEPRRQPRQGRRPQRCRRDHPVRPGDRHGAEAAAADLPALDQQVLHPRPQAGKILHPLGGRAGPAPSSSSPGSIPTSGTAPRTGKPISARACNTPSTRSRRRPASAR